jgi:phospholipid-binding lipoprotein MlaA
MKSPVPLMVLALTLGGCATNGVEMHRMPPETPAADNAAAVKKVAALVASAKEAEKAKQEAPAEAPAPLTAADAPPPQTYDPWERINRFTYRFNSRFDEAIFLPAANGYRWIPLPIRSGVHHIFENLSEVDSVINYTLQGRLGYGVRSFGRFVINSTIGIAGVFDVASKFKLAYAPTGFGTTLAKWGMHPGPFVVIPFYGPSTLRGAVGLLGDYGTSYGIDLGDLYRGTQSYGVGVVNAVDQRANVSFRYYSTGSPFEYDTVRFLFVRKQLLEDAGLHPKEKPKKRDDAVPAGQ